MAFDRWGQEFIVNSTAQGNQERPQIRVLANGNFIVTYSSTDLGDGSFGNARGRLFAPDGTPIGNDVIINTTTLGGVERVRSAFLANGNLMTSWLTDTDGVMNNRGTAILGRLYDSQLNPLGSDFPLVTATSGEITGSFISRFPGGPAFVGYTLTGPAGTDASGNSIWLQKLTPEGLPTGAAVQLNSTTAGNQSFYDITQLSDGRYAIAFESNDGGDGSGFGIRMRFLDANLNPVGNDFLVNGTTQGAQTNANILGQLTNGNILIAYDSTNSGSSDVRLRVLDSSGNGVGPDVVLNQTTAGDQFMNNYARLPDGRFFTIFYSDTGDGSGSALFGRILTPEGIPEGNEFLIATTTAGNQLRPAIRILSDNRVAVTWESYDGGDGSGNVLRAQIFDPRGAEFTVRANGTPQLGSEADNIIYGSSAADRIFGLGGNDLIHGSPGNDFVDGGTGIDTLAYSGFFRQFSISGTLASRTLSAAAEGTDTLESMEILRFADGRLVSDVSDTIAIAYRMYDSAFNRAPDPLGLNFWSAALEKGSSVVDMATAFVGSPEFQATYGSLSNQSFVEQLYRNVLDREGDAGGISHWTGVLNSGAQTRGQVLAGFSESAENIEKMRPQVEAGLWDINETAASVARLYHAALDRAPDVGGLTFWIDALEGGRGSLGDIADGFANSAEFQEKYGSLNNRGYVEQLYRNVLDREGDAGGINYWTEVLNAGQLDRGDVLLGFAESIEHQVKTLSVIDQGIMIL